MIRLTIKGVITHFFDEKYQHSKYSSSFLKQKILVESEGQNYTLSFLKEKIEYLKYCKIGSEIEMNATLKGRKWEFKNKEYSVNELECNSLKIIRNTKFEDYIYHNREKYGLKKDYVDDNLLISLININDESEYLLSINISFPDKKLNTDHIFLWDQTDDEIIEQLQQKGVLTKGSWGKKDIFGGYISKILILDLFKNGDVLYPENDKQNKIVENENDVNESNLFVDETDYTHYDENLDADQQSDEFWNQF